MLNVQVFRGTSVNRQNAGGTEVAICGRFAAVVEVDRFSVDKSADGFYFVLLPLGSSCHGDWTEAEAEEALQASIERSDWTTDRSLAESDAIAAAESRHREHCERSEAYRRRWEQPAT